MRRTRIVIGSFVAVALVIGGNTMAGAQAEKQRRAAEQRQDDDRRSERAANAAGPKEDRRGGHKKGEAKKEEVRLDCRSGNVDGAAVVGCRWPAYGGNDFGGYALHRRSEGEDSKVVFRTRERGQHQYRDKDVTSPKSYGYRVTVHDTSGRVIGRSRVVKVDCCPPASDRSTTTTTGREPPPPRPDGAMRMGCAPATKDGRDAVGCKWTPSDAERFARYRLFREVEGSARPTREMVYETADRDASHFLDGTVSRGTTYVYAVEALDRRGEVIGRSGPVRVECCPDREPRPQPSDGQLRMACTGMARDGRTAVGCKWSPSDADRFARYRLSREIEGSAGPATVVYETTDRSAAHFLDRNVSRGTTYVYRVQVLDESGAAFAHGGPVRVQCCAESQPPEARDGGGTKDSESADAPRP